MQVTRELELALGDGIKWVEKNELETVVIQRRALRAVTDLQAGKNYFFLISKHCGLVQKTGLIPWTLIKLLVRLY